MKLHIRLKGSDDSGNHGHSGRPGKRGGSAPKEVNLYRSIPKSQLPDFIKEGTRLAITDSDLGDTTLLIDRIVDDKSYEDTPRIWFKIVNHAAPTGFDDYRQGIKSFTEYLLASKVRKHSGSGA